jgi:pimeloyl-ACP methyl ester carboxylesterase
LSSFLYYKKSVIAWQKWGNGSKITICFHGYGEDGTSFSFLEKYAGDSFTFYAIDLPFHGNTIWNEGLIFNQIDLENIITLLLPDKNNHITLIGYSLGGRIALNLYQIIPERIEKIILLAPDGLKINFWYWFSTQTRIGNKLFSFTMKYPGWFFGFLKILNRLKLVNASIFKFVNHYIGDKHLRAELYNRWTALRKIKPHVNYIKQLVKKFRTQIRLLYGKHDRIIIAARGKKFKKGIEKFCRLSIIHSGHQVLHEKHIQEILPALAD